MVAPGEIRDSRILELLLAPLGLWPEIDLVGRRAAAGVSLAHAHEGVVPHRRAEQTWPSTARPAWGC